MLYHIFGVVNSSQIFQIYFSPLTQTDLFIFKACLNINIFSTGYDVIVALLGYFDQSFWLGLSIKGRLTFVNDMNSRH